MTNTLSKLFLINLSVIVLGMNLLQSQEYQMEQDLTGYKNPPNR